MELIFVTNNPGKLKEIRSLLGEHLKLRSLKDIGFDGEIPETSPTLEGNSSAKAFYIYDRFLVDCFADDTGLEVEVLNNKPGVFSARFAEMDSPFRFTDKKKLTEANIQKLLKLMDRRKSRKARFRTVISLVFGGKEILFEGIVKGKITSEKRGEGGFGYDPVFIPEGQSKTFAQMSLEEKNRISHRAIAFRKLVSYLEGNPDLVGNNL